MCDVLLVAIFWGRAAFFVNQHEFEQVTGYRHTVSPSLCRRSL
jgi:hypothetical protein